MPLNVEVLRLSQAIEEFKGRPPVGIPEEVMDGLADIEKRLTGWAPDNDSPGKQAAKAAAGTGVHYSQAAKGTDQSAEGQS